MKQLQAGFVLALLLGPVCGLAQTGGQPANIKGYVLDSACACTKNLKKPISPECAVACAKAGSPLVILTDGGTIYWPISDAMPAQSQNERLMEFAGKRVIVAGKVYQRAGSRMIALSKVQAE